MIPCISLFLTTALFQAPGDANQSGGSRPFGAEVLHTIPLREIVAAAPIPRPPLLGSFLSGAEATVQGNSVMSHTDKVAARLSGEHVVEIVREGLGGAGGRGVVLRTTEQMLMIAGSEDDVRRAREVVRGVGDVVGRPIRITVTVFRPGAIEEAKVVLPPGGSEPQVRGFEVLWEANTLTRSAVPVALTNERFTRFVRDLEVEVAQRADIGDPKTDVMFEGVRVVVEPHSLATNDGILLFGQIAVGERRGPVTTRSTGILDYPSIDVPLVETNCAAVSGLVEDGGGLLLTIGGSLHGGGRTAVAISARFERPRADPGSRVAIYPTSALTTRGFDAMVATNDDDSSRLYRSTDSPFPIVKRYQPPGFGVVDRSTLEDMATSAVAGRDGVKVWSVGEFLAVSGDRDAQAAVASVLGQLEQQWLRTVQVDVATEQRATNGGDGVFRRGDANEPAGEPLHRVSLPALLGRPHFVIRGLESTAIQDLDVEIAQRAQASDPKVVSTFSGLVASLVPYGTERGVAADLSIDVAFVPTPIRRPVESRTGGDLYPPQTDYARFSHAGAIVLGEDRDLGDGPLVRLDGSVRQTRQKIRFRQP
jgi:hypothetical protein